ncbi:inner membrane protein AmpE [Legionella beliardensis]|uniref:Inner membrane protein AmpE n=1 Tax=Legionella beliardensis TaxID=91822 RepID=A0A378I0N8_9GAMM|nr:hypothetical protein [Legionella beliardensis]STX28758.1 inner membrane protein AmpE [Legionella beliardensis]
MKLLIILISVLSERHLIHAISATRFNWFSNYVENLTGRFPQAGFIQNPYIALLLLIVPLLLIVWILFALIGHLLFGFLGFLMSLAIFYYCIGPENPFYPMSAPNDELENELAAGNYFAKVNNQLFGIIFWFVVFGPLFVLFYRLVSLCVHYDITKRAALRILTILDWPTSRVTLMLYLFVGNFQQGFNYYQQMFLSSPQNNEAMLSTGGLLAARSQEDEVITLAYAQSLVEHALVVYLILIAVFTLSIWL